MNNVTPAAGLDEKPTIHTELVGQINDEPLPEVPAHMYCRCSTKLPLQLKKDTKMITNGEKFNAICEFFPAKVREMAKSAEVSIGELRGLIVRGDYYIDDRCRLRRNATVKAFNELADAVNKLNAKEKPQKETKMIDLKLGDVCDVESHEEINAKVIATHDGLTWLALEHGGTIVVDIDIVSKHDSRHWLKDLPDAGLFNCG